MRCGALSSMVAINYDGLNWQSYDTHYWMNAAAAGNQQWLQLMPTFTPDFSQAKHIQQPHALYLTAWHTWNLIAPTDRAHLGWRANAGSLSQTPLIYTSAKWWQWPPDYCAEFNAKGTCSFYMRCKCRHACGEYKETHIARVCPLTQSQPTS